MKFDRFVERTQQIADLFQDFYIGCDNATAEEYVEVHNKACELLAQNERDLLDMLGPKTTEGEDSNG